MTLWLCSRFHLRKANEADKIDRVITNRWFAYSGIYTSITNLIDEAPGIAAYFLGCHLITTGGLAASDVVMFPTSVSRIIHECAAVRRPFPVFCF